MTGNTLLGGLIILSLAGYYNNIYSFLSIVQKSNSSLRNPFTLLGEAVIGWLLYEAMCGICTSPECLRRRIWQAQHRKLAHAHHQTFVP